MSNYNKRWWVMVGVGIASFIGCIDFTIVNTALPAIQQSLHLSFTQLQWVMNVFMFMLPVFLVIAGRLGDVYGHRKILYLSVIIFGLSSLGAGMSSSIIPLLINRGIQGIAAAGMFPSAAAVVLNAFPEEEQGKALGSLYGIYGIGLAIGPVVGGLLVGLFGWRWIFLVNVPVIVISFIICLPTVAESVQKSDEKLDYLGVILLIIGLGSLTVAIAEGNNFGWGSLTIISLFIIGIIVMIFWVRVEWHSESPTLNLRYFNRRNVIVSLIGASTLGVFYSLGFFLMPLYLDNVRHLSAIATGGLLLSTSLLLAILSPIMGYLMDRYSVKYLICAGMFFFVIMAAMQLAFGLHTSFVFVAISFVVFGIGWGMLGAPLMTALVAGLPRELSGVAVGSLWTIQNVGAVVGLAVGIAIFQFVVGHSMTNQLQPSVFMQGYHAAMTLLLVVSVCTLVFVFCVMKKIKDAQVRSS